jgi:hypothetical protein
MHAEIQMHFQTLVDDVQETALPADRKEVFAGSIQRLSALYIKFRQADESRYFDEITRLVQALLKDLEVCPEAQKLDADFREKLRLLHEELGLPKLALKSTPPPKPKKARKKP